MAEVPDPFEVKAEVERGARVDDPLGRTIRIALRFRGSVLSEVADPGNRGYFAEIAMRTSGPSSAQARAIAEEAMKAADSVYSAIYAAVWRATHDFECLHSPEVKHPTVALREEIEALRKELEDATDRMAEAQTQRDELRRLFAPEPIYGLGGVGGSDS